MSYKFLWLLVLINLITAVLANDSSLPPIGRQPIITINSIAAGKMQGDTQPSEFSTNIYFTNGQYPLLNWQLGFYIPRIFASLTSETQSINPRLNMQICTVDNTHCRALILQQAGTITRPDQSLGNTIILAPKSRFILLPHKKYLIKLQHNNQWSIANYSAYPQNFFAVVKGKVFHIPTTKEMYKLLDYHAAAVESQIESHILDNWNHSNIMTRTLDVVPSPQQFIPQKGGFQISTLFKIHNTLNPENTIANFMAEWLQRDLQISVRVDNDLQDTSGIVIKPILGI